MGYWICEAKTVKALCEQVNGFIRKGWQPLGGMVILQSRSTSDWWFYQAMVIEEAIPEDHGDPELL